MAIFSNLSFLFFALLALGACIFVHELGHFLAARRRGLLVERFSIGFGPRLFGWKSDGVDYRVSLLPFGGYVALPQLADMGRIEGGENEGSPLPPISYADKMIVAVMGAVFNIIFAFLLALILWGVGREMPVDSQTTIVGHVSPQVVTTAGETVPGPAYEAGLQAKDVIVQVDGRPVRDWLGVMYSIITGSGMDNDGRRLVNLTIERNGEILSKEVNPILVTSEATRDIGISQSSPIYIRELREGFPAEQAGFRAGDELISIDGAPIISFGFFRDYLATRVDQPVELTVQRGDELYTAMVAAIDDPAGGAIIGFVVGHVTERVHQNPVQQIAGMATMIQQTLAALFNSRSDVQVSNMSGPAGIVHAIHVSASIGLSQALWLIIFINVNLAILNLLPIPVLDGGHMLFATIAKLRGKALPQRFLEATQGSFIILLLGFMVYVSFFDIRRIFEFYGGGAESPPASTAPAEPGDPESNDP